MVAFCNLIWFVICFGWLQGLVWLIVAVFFAITIIGLPIARACLEFAKLSAFPFGKDIIRETELKGTDNVSWIVRTITIILNIIWFPIGLFLTVVFFILGIISFITIIGIPVGIVYVRMGQFLLFPIGARVVSKKQAQTAAIANELRKNEYPPNRYPQSYPNANVIGGGYPIIGNSGNSAAIGMANGVLPSAFIFCRNCGKQLTADAKFCNSCGTPTA
jgi:uncharacterized membrane protein YccF (DUF307 family)/ribosomal protein L37E